MVIFSEGNFQDCVTRMLCMIAIFPILTSMPSYLCHGVISKWEKISAINAKLH